MARAAKKARPGADVDRTSAVPGDLRVQYRLISDLVPYARNPRTHSDEQVWQIVAFLQKLRNLNQQEYEAISAARRQSQHEH